VAEESNNQRTLRERLGGTAEDRLGRALSDLLESPLLTGAIGRAFDAREKAAQAQEVALGALNLPSAADIERLTRRLRSVSHRLEGIEEGVDRLDNALSPRTMEARLTGIERQLEALAEKLEEAVRAVEASSPSSAAGGVGRANAAGAATSAAGAAKGAAGAAKGAAGAAKGAAGAAKGAAGTGGGKAKRPPAGKRKGAGATAGAGAEARA